MPVILQGGKVFQGFQPIDSNLPKIWSNGKAVRFTIDSSSFNNTAYWDWSALHFQGSPSSFVFVPDPDDGGLQGDYSIGTGSATSKYPNAVNTYDLTPTLYEIEPAGGTGKFSIKSRDLTYWHKYSPILISYQFTKPDNDMEFEECQWKFTNVTSRNGTITDTVKVPSNNNTKGSTYIKQTTLYTLQSDNIGGANVNQYAPSQSSNSDLTINFKIGPNNTSEASYCDIAMIGFVNETQSESEYFTDSTTFGTYTISNSRNVPFTKLDPAIRRTLDKKVPDPMIKMIRVWQKPNILFYVHMKYINLQYVDYDNPPPASMVLENWTVGWNVKKEEILLYIEFGVSPNGGKTIWWNGVEADPNIGGTIGAKLRKKGITTVVPTNINEYLIATLLNYSLLPESVNGKPYIADSSISRYNISTKNATVHGTKAFKYVRIPIWTDLVNDEYANVIHKRKQKYQVINIKEFETSTTETGIDDPGIDKINHKRLNHYFAQWKSKSKSAEYFQIGRKNKTEPWSTNIHIDLFYKKDSLKYIGATDGKTVLSKS